MSEGRVPSPSADPGGWPASEAGFLGEVEGSAEEVRVGTREIFGDDDRRPVDDPSAYPWRTLCLLLIEANDGRDLVGTGWLAGPRLVVTAGHCVFDREFGGWAKSIEVLPGVQGSQEPPYGTFRAERRDLESVDGWVDDGKREFDYGAILLPVGTGQRPPGERAGHLGFAAASQSSLERDRVFLAGYPTDLEHATVFWHALGLTRVGSRTLLHTIDTKGGQSGAPLWRIADGRPQVIGIHSGARNHANQAVRITPRVHANLMTWKRAAS